MTRRCSPMVRTGPRLHPGRGFDPRRRELPCNALVTHTDMGHAFGPFEKLGGASIRGHSFPLGISLGLLGLGYPQVKQKKKKDLSNFKLLLIVLNFPENTYMVISEN